MYLTIFIILLSLSLILIFLGYFTKEPNFTVILVGWTFLFTLALVLIPSTPEAIEYISGETAFTNATNYTTTTNNYTEYESNTFGVYLAIVAFLGFISTIFQLKSDFPEV